MGFYYGPSTPPSRWTIWRQRIARHLPQWLKNWWADVAEIVAISRIVFGIIMPVFAMMMAFALACVGVLFLYMFLAGPR